MSGNRCRRLIIGCGYLGLRVARIWQARGDRVAALTRSPKRAADWQAIGLEPLIGDILSPWMLGSLPAAATVLYAVGFDPHSGASRRTVYVEGLRNVLDHLPSTVERFLYVSSTSVYGQTRGEWVDESSICEPRSERGRICLDAERLLSSALGGRVPYHVLRLSGIYGPGRLIARTAALREGHPLSGDADHWLNLIHVEDAARAIIACGEQDAAPGETWLVSDDRPIRRRAYYEALARLVGAPPPVFDASAQGSADPGKRCDNRRLRDELGVSLEFPTIDEGLPHAVATDR